MKELEYKEVIEKLKKEFNESISYSDPELMKEFENYLNRTIKSIKEFQLGGKKFDESSVKPVLESMANRIIAEDIQMKRKDLIKDVNFEKIRQISMKAFTVAQDVLKGKELEEELDIDGEMKKLETLLNSVEEYNKEQARNLVSEAILDLNFIANPNSEMVSLRLGEIIRLNKSEQNNKRIKEEEER